MNVAEALKLLQLDVIDEEWTSKVWDSEFLDIDGIPAEYEELLESMEVVEILSAVKVNIKNSRQDTIDDEPDAYSWPVLVQEYGVQYKELLALLVYLMKTGQANPANEQALQICVKAACVYLLLLTIHGSNAYFIFQMSIYELALETILMGNLLTETSGKKSRSADDTQNEDDEPGNSSKCRKLTERSKYYLIQGLHEMLHDLSFMASYYPLVEDDALRKVVFNLVALTRIDTISSNINLRNLRNDFSMSSLTVNAYIILRQLCDPMHGDVEETVNIILMFLLPSVVMGGKHLKELPFPALSKICNHSVSFVAYLILTVKEESYKGVFIFLQHLCMSVIDKAEYRQKTAESVVCILRLLPTAVFDKTIKWFLKFSHSKKSSHRLFAVEIISKLLHEDERPALPESGGSENANCAPFEGNVGEGEAGMMDCDSNDQPTASQEVAIVSVSHKYLLGVLFSRCHDKSSSVRTKALCNLADCMRSNNRVIYNLMEEIFVTPYIDNDNISNSDIVERGFMDSALFLKSLDNPQSQDMDPLPGGKAVVSELLLLSQDDKVYVRKAALQMLESIMKLNRKWMNRELLEVLCDHCRDPSLLIKKQSIQALTDLLFLHPEDGLLPEMYVSSVLPQLSNAEMKVQEKVLEVMQKVIFQNLMTYDRTSTPLSKLPWKVLLAVIKNKKRTFFLNACFHWYRSGDIPRTLVRLLRTHIGTENNIPAWMFLTCIAEYQDIKDPAFALEYYRDHHTDPSEEVKYGVIQALQVLGMSCKHLPTADQEQLLLELLDALRSMRLHFSLVGLAVTVATLITQQNAPSVKEGRESVVVWGEELLKLCESYINQHSPVEKMVVSVNMEHYTRALVLLGDVVQVCPGQIKLRTVENILYIFMTEKQCHPQLWKAEGLAALAVLTLGKICLQHELLAKRIVPVIGNLLTRVEGLAIKVNTMNVLADMCVRYTAMVEPLVPKMCSCLTDPHVDVRYNSLLILIRLLQQDFLKLRGTLFFYLLNMLRDPARMVRELINYYICECLVKRHNSVMFHNIVESIFYFNKYEGHEIYRHITEKDSNHLFDLSGPSNRKDRQRLYRFMCEHMEDGYRIKTIQKICVDIFGGVVANMITLNEQGESVVKDAFFILSCEELKLAAFKKTTNEDDSQASGDQMNAVMNTAKKTLLTEVLKKQLFEVCVPILLQLRVKLGSVDSQLLPILRHYMRDLMKDYKDELMDIFSDNKFFAEEILAEIQKEEEELQAEKRRRNTADNETSEVVEEEGGPGLSLLVQIATDHLRNLQTNEEQRPGPVEAPSAATTSTAGSNNTSVEAAISKNTRETTKMEVASVGGSGMEAIPSTSSGERRTSRTPPGSGMEAIPSTSSGERRTLRIPPGSGSGVEGTPSTSSGERRTSRTPPGSGSGVEGTPSTSSGERRTSRTPPGSGMEAIPSTSSGERRTSRTPPGSGGGMEAIPSTSSGERRTSRTPPGSGGGMEAIPSTSSGVRRTSSIPLDSGGGVEAIPSTSSGVRRTSSIPLDSGGGVEAIPSTSSGERRTLRIPPGSGSGVEGTPNTSSGERRTSRTPPGSGGGMEAIPSTSSGVRRTSSIPLDSGGGVEAIPSTSSGERRTLRTPPVGEKGVETTPRTSAGERRTSRTPPISERGLEAIPSTSAGEWRALRTLSDNAVETASSVGTRERRKSRTPSVCESDTSTSTTSSTRERRTTAKPAASKNRSKKRKNTSDH